MNTVFSVIRSLRTIYEYRLCEEAEETSFVRVENRVSRRRTSFVTWTIVRLVGKMEIISSHYQWKRYQRGAYSKTLARHNIPVIGLTATTHDFGPLSFIPCCLIVPPELGAYMTRYSYFYPLFDFLSNEFHTNERSNPFN